MIAKHTDPEINKLYKARRKAATAADGSGLRPAAIRHWRRNSPRMASIAPDSSEPCSAS